MAAPEDAPVEKLATKPRSDSSTLSRRRSLLPRFGLRTALIFAVVFCLAMAWLGRNFARIREEDAAIETLKQAGATIYIRSGLDDIKPHPATPFQTKPPNWDSVPSFPMRLLGLSGPAEVTSVRFHDDQPKDESLDEALAALARFPELKSVELSGSSFTDASLDSLTPLKNLRELTLFSTSVTGDGLAQIASPERFRRLRVSRMEPRLATVVASMRELRDVQVYDMPASRADMEALASLPRLESLSLLKVRPSDESFYSPLAKAQRLRRLWILSSSLGDADMNVIEKLPRLEILDVDGITDAGVEEFDPLTRLRWVEFQSPVSLAAARKFSSAYPDGAVAAWGANGRQRYLAGDKISPGMASEFNGLIHSKDD
ncbi:MAG TPA: hypothetical protein VGN57_15865 [Pirellulaceae bacterium]|jgi:hypothetical protein|nr:hypothetical protein [Pirellulaceae bacterium]